MGDGTVLRVEGLSKRFGATNALIDADLTIRAGEIHALVGENGSGKSTLVKILAGFHVPDEGVITIGGRPVPIPIPPGQADQLGIAFVHQDLGLIEDMTVLENLLIHDYLPERGSRWFRHRRRELATALNQLRRHRVEVDPLTKVATLRPLQKALVAIVRAMVRVEDAMEEGAQPLLVLDEPTVFLPPEDVAHLFSLVRDITARGAGVLFVSHDLDEVLGLADAVTVLRDGRVQITLDLHAGESPVTKERLVELIVGHPVTRTDKPAAVKASDEGTALEVTGARGNVLKGIDLVLRRGEIVGLTGLAGSGFEELPYLLFGASPALAGRLKVGGEDVELASMNPARAMELGMALLPGDRAGLSGVGQLTVGENVLLPTVSRYFRSGRLRSAPMSARLSEVLQTFDVRPRMPNLPLAKLSGGNQQKALVAKWMEMQPRIFLLHEPTQGVDVGAREGIFRILRDFAAAGGAAVIASSDLEQLESLCSRVLVFARGRVSAELAGPAVSKSQLSVSMLTA